ncbi:hypothetical protein OG21DRAFT_1490801 [Imleria badia]|nr:hypothetical protein OG21DRAFT_1490801 [Imleria badia]
MRSHPHPPFLLEIYPTLPPPPPCNNNKGRTITLTLTLTGNAMTPLDSANDTITKEPNPARSTILSAIIKKEESPLVIPLLFEETGDTKKEDCQSPSLSSYRTRSLIEPTRGYTPHPPSIYNPSTPVRSPSLLPEPIDWEQILIIPRRSPTPRSLTSDNGSSIVVESIGGILH